MPPTVTKTKPMIPLKKPPLPTTRTSPSGSVWDRVKPMELPDDLPIRMMLYGKGGTGKTSIWGSFPGPILVAVVSGGKESGELLSINTEEHREKVSPVYLEKAQELTDLADGAKSRGFATLVLDHVSGFQDMVLGEVTGKPVPEQKSWGFASQQEYGAATARTKEHLRHLLDAGINVVIVGHERESDKRDDSELIQPHVGVATMPQLANWLNGAVDYIAQTFIRDAYATETTMVGKMQMATRKAVVVNGVQQVEYCLRTAPSATYMTKFRVPKGRGEKGIIVDPDYAKIMAAIQG